MPSTTEIRARMQSVRETKKVTDAMYMTSSVKMRHARREVENTAPYFAALMEQIAELLLYIPDTDNAYFHLSGMDRPNGILLVTSDKGLAGSYNQTAIRVAEEYMRDHPDTLLFIIGEYGRQYFQSRKIPFAEDFVYSADLPSIWEAGRMCLDLLEYFNDRRVDEIHIISTDYRNGRPSECRRQCLLPLDKSDFKSEKARERDSFKEFYPDADTVLSEIIPSYLTGTIYSLLVDSYCSEQEARMTAMQTAGNNAEEVLRSLGVQYNSLRQTAITQEMTEITSGARALGQKKNTEDTP